MDCVGIDIPDEMDSDYQEYHGEHGWIVAVLSDNTDSLTTDERDAQLYRVAFDFGETADFRWRDLWPSLNDSSQA